MTWRDLQYDYGRTEVSGHREVLRELYAAYQVRASNYHAHSDRAVHLDELGPSVWRLLERALEAGVALVPANASAGPITLAPEPARVRLDLWRDDEGGAAVCWPPVVIRAILMSRSGSGPAKGCPTP